MKHSIYDKNDDEIVVGEFEGKVVIELKARFFEDCSMVFLPIDAAKDLIRALQKVVEEAER